MKYKIAFIGSGNVAVNLAHSFDRVGHTITQVISRNVDNAKTLARKYGAYYGTELSEIYYDADFIFICVNDESYSSVVSKVPQGLKALLCHTSGPISIDILEPYTGNYGVFYPLQSLRKEELAVFLEVPIFIEYSSSKSKEMLMNLADSISNKVREVNSEDRHKYHLAAVFANNFTNYMYTISDEYLTKEGLDFQNLLPIIKETAIRLRIGQPKSWQTGPAKRGDREVIDKHLSMLSTGKWKKIYELLSNSLISDGS